MTKSKDSRKINALFALEENPDLSRAGMNSSKKTSSLRTCSQVRKTLRQQAVLGKTSVFRPRKMLLPLKYLRKHFVNRKVAIPLRNYLSIALFFQVILFIIVLFFAGLSLENVKGIKNERDKNYMYWTSVVEQYPNEPDILFNAGKSAYESGKKEVALKYIEKALQIDPLFEKAMQFEKEIEK